MRNNAVFLDTSIQIARKVHSSRTKAIIKKRLEGFQFTLTSEVVKQEYKRRVLKEAQYLLNQLNKRKSLTAVNQHIINVLPPQQSRKRTICLELISQVFGQAAEPELTERAFRYLRTLLVTGMSSFDRSVGHVIRDLGCACSRYPIEERERYARYEFGPDKCSAAGHVCGVAQFIASRPEQTAEILRELEKLPAGKKSREVSKAEDFLRVATVDPALASRMDPCLQVGDLLIALESANIPVFYTLNSKESQHFCRILRQDLVIRSPNPDRPEIELASSEQPWPDF